MTFNFLKVSCLVITLSFTYCATICAQVHKEETHLRSKQIVINSFEWTFDKTTGIARASIIIANNSELEIKSITALFTGQAKNGVILQSSGIRTIRRKSVTESILPDETKTIVIDKVFKNQQLATLNLIQLEIVYANGSVEFIK
ncbi:hypothetical protein F0919_08475 [Taibaiella lutea]|uniref:Uncharacterized protein n=1 Tax=Taibaiella lutea TaxID=2608001 RepID=A0A5M6CJL9_9BACT|nr:hypothetical protein [Taibaiella lutea]KAA5534640.1 hypothetical protein F0919_08475 [Taibaiella lutea]